MKKYLMLITAMFMLVVAMPMAFAVDDNNTVTPDPVGDGNTTEGNTTVEEEGEKIVTYTADYEALDEKDDLKTKIDNFIKDLTSVDLNEYGTGAVGYYASDNALQYNSTFASIYNSYKDVLTYEYESMEGLKAQFDANETGRVIIKSGEKTYATVIVDMKVVNVLIAYNAETEEEMIASIITTMSDFFEIPAEEIEVTAKDIPEDFEVPNGVLQEYIANKIFTIKTTINGKAIEKDFLLEVYTAMGDAPVYYDEEANVGVYVDTEDEIPDDIELQVKPITKGMGTYAKIKDTIKTDNFFAFDINLYSPSADKYLTKLETGKFLVELYLGEEYVGKDMTAYYIKEDGSLEAHPLEIDEEGYAYFETTHFSTYFITETLKLDSNNKVPNTVDNGVAYILAGTLGLVTMLGSAILISKRK